VENHFSGKQIDDTLSYAAFDLYLKQLDYQKRLLLAEEVSQLEIFKDRIDDEVQSGRVVLAPSLSVCLPTASPVQNYWQKKHCQSLSLLMLTKTMKRIRRSLNSVKPEKIWLNAGVLT